MKRELAAIMRGAGYEIEWLARGAAPDAPELFVVTLDGVCAPQSPTDGPSLAGASLATTSIVDGRVLPFSTIACPALNRTLAPALAKEPGAIRDFLLGRAMARVLAHEFYHVLAGTKEHTHGGIARSGFTAADLLTERFDFEPSVLAKLHPKHEVDLDWGDEGTGRL